jgi:hypothetical protein
VASTRERASHSPRGWLLTILLLSCFCLVSFLLRFLSLPSTRRTKHRRSLDCTDFVLHVIRVFHLILTHTLQRWLAEPPYASFQHQFCGCSPVPRLQRVPSPSTPRAPHQDVIRTQHNTEVINTTLYLTLATVVMASLNLQLNKINK